MHIRHSILLLFLLPALSFAGYTFTYPEKDLEVTAGSAAIFHGVIENTGAAEASFTISTNGTTMPDDWTLTFCADGSCFPPYVTSYTYSIAAGDTASVSIDFFTNTPGTGFTYFKIEVDGEPDATDSTLFTAYTSTGIGESTDLSVQPSSFHLAPVYPNPFNSSAVIEFSLPQTAPVNLLVITPDGRRVQTLHNGTLSQGSHRFAFQSTPNMASGLYLVKLEALGRVEMTRAMLIK